MRKERYDWGKWVSPMIGKLAITTPREVLADAIEDIRDKLDAAVKRYQATDREEGISGKTAQNIWSVVRTTFKESMGARERKLRVRTDDPSAGMKPPLSTPSRAKTFLYPVEVTKLLACEDVPLEWRQTYAVATYAYAGRGLDQ